MLHLDGSTLEGGGQLVRIAAALSALTGKPLSISRIRANRSGSKGLKASHCAAIKFLLDVCGGTAVGNQVGHHELSIYPRGQKTGRSSLQTKREDNNANSDLRKSAASLQQLSLTSLYSSPRVTVKSEYDIRLSTPGSVFLIFQALYPYLLFAGACTPTIEADAGTSDTVREHPKGIRVNITGGTHVSFSPSYDYISQVLIPNFAKFGLPPLSMELKKRGWATGQWAEVGAVSLVISPLSANGTPSRSDTISSPSHDSGRAQAETPPVVFPSIELDAFDKGFITQIDVTILAPDTLAQKLLKELSAKSAKGRNRDKKLQKKAVLCHDPSGVRNPYREQETSEDGDEYLSNAGEQAACMGDACNMKQGPPQTAREFIQLETIRTLSRELNRQVNREQSVLPTTPEIDDAEVDEMQSHRINIGDVVVNLHTSEATSHYSQTYILLVAHTSTGFRLGRDALYSSFHHGPSRSDSKTGKKARKGSARSSADSGNILLRMKGMIDQCVTDLMDEFESHPGDQGQGRRIIIPKKAVDVYMRDQLVVFEALGRLTHPGPHLSAGGEQRDEEGVSLHTRTAKWVCEQILGCP
ncbi:TPA_exp: putative RNA 3'-terminal phosphate cyclase [Trichophyton benhamiae CBS 112371]|uniref:RNA 3'-terminal phosphate cyclase, putative n=1 Tax=Arthroderma benhamiae (strain ATCC MYA-4681 / CBS 112371) TaxID=663331 RepID=D4AKF6_ARTBC|nr:RNA 3'-terminal phosphate cyclase, putative [Trichophyton benhamiae CBS 112371]EFE36457.1 RNA 3'-terminal phosphate cyclase, putative [Trichophyton benhamiae CBS 112371]DAA79249.1 TPA_exp: putative RNA 3'-terminal phosphate cyclase [Trichophyton benhamiae CBS 112371]